MSARTRGEGDTSANAIPRLMRVALQAAAAGHFVFPLRPRSKKPAVKHWESAATRDPAVISAFWQSTPHNVGIACGPSGLHVIDLDDAHGHEPPPRWAGARHGRDVLACLAAAAGRPYPSDTYTVRSPTGGLHLYFLAPAEPRLRNTVARLGWRVDSRGPGGYVVAAGSIRAEGVYRAMNRRPIAPLPRWLIPLLAPPVTAPTILGLPVRCADAYVDKAVEAESLGVVRAQPGQRHVTLLRAAGALGRLVAGGELTEHDARTALRDAAAHHVGHEGFTATEAERTISDGLAYGARRPRRIARHPGSVVRTDRDADRNS